MNSNKLLIAGDEVMIDSPIRMKKIHKKKGIIKAFSYEHDNVVAYAVSIEGICYTVLVDEVMPTGNFINPDQDMTNESIKVIVNHDGTGEINSIDERLSS